MFKPLTVAALSLVAVSMAGTAALVTDPVNPGSSASSPRSASLAAKDWSRRGTREGTAPLRQAVEGFSTEVPRRGMRDNGNRVARASEYTSIWPRRGSR